MMLTSERRIPVVIGFTLALLVPARVVAEPHRFDRPREMFMLPEYCKYTQDFRDHIPGANNKDEVARWTAVIGPTFIHMHHYCYGLQATNRAAFMSPTREERMHNLGVSVTEFDYVIDRAPADFSLLPEILTKKGENLIQLTAVGKGMAELQRAIDMKADQWEAYAAISDYYKEVGQLAKAREWLEKGLANRPNTMPLMRRLSALDASQGKRATR
jgi:tetratricopeptide (TPR) repeat protein